MTRPGWPQGRTLGLLLLAVASLAVGLAVYALGRAPGSAMAWPAAWSLGTLAGVPKGGAVSRGLGLIAGSLPSFVHALAFAVLSVLLLPRTRAWALTACCGWAAIDTVFEVFQHPSLSAHAAQWLQGLGLGSALQWCADKTARYLLFGRFDPWDVLAGLLGGLVAYAVCRYTLQDREKSAG